MSKGELRHDQRNGQPGRIQAISSQFRSQLLAHEAQAMNTLETAHAHALAPVRLKLKAISKTISDKQANGEGLSPGFLHQSNQLNGLKNLIQNAINHFAALAQKLTGQLQHLGATIGQQLAQALLRVSNVDHVGAPAQPRQNTLTHLFTGYGEEAANETGKALILGTSLGWEPSYIESQVDQALDLSRNRALVTAKAESARSFKSSQFAVYQANDDTVSGWIWICSFSHSCAACIAMHGSRHDLSEELQDHVCGHCVAAPITNGSAPDVESGSDWFDDQDESVQREAFSSNAAYQAFKKGDIALSDVVQYHKDPGYGTSISQKPAKVLIKKARVIIMGGKPSKGTKRDQRLKENKPPAPKPPTPKKG